MRGNVLIEKYDVGLIYDLINAYYYKNEKNPSYILMNLYTLSELRCLTTLRYEDKIIINEEGPYKDKRYFMYRGIPIATCEKLEDGEIELL